MSLAYELTSMRASTAFVALDTRATMEAVDILHAFVAAFHEVGLARLVFIQFDAFVRAMHIYTRDTIDRLPFAPPLYGGYGGCVIEPVLARCRGCRDGDRLFVITDGYGFGDMPPSSVRPIDIVIVAKRSWKPNYRHRCSYVTLID